MAYQLKYDSTQGRYKGDVDSDEKSLTVDGKKIYVYNEYVLTFFLGGNVNVVPSLGFLV